MIWYDNIRLFCPTNSSQLEVNNLSGLFKGGSSSRPWFVCLSVCMFWMPTSLDIINLHDCNHVYVIRHIYFKLSGVWFIQHVVVWNWVCVCVCVFCSVQCYLVIGDSGHVTRALESRRSVGVNILALFYTFLYHPNVFVVLSLTTCAHSVKLIWFWVTR